MKSTVATISVKESKDAFEEGRCIDINIRLNVDTVLEIANAHGENIARSIVAVDMLEMLEKELASEGINICKSVL